jgi:hypothetical protein
VVWNCGSPIESGGWAKASMQCFVMVRGENCEASIVFRGEPALGECNSGRSRIEERGVELRDSNRKRGLGQGKHAVLRDGSRGELSRRA